MADGVDISLVGDKKLQRVFKRLEGKVQKKIARKGIRAGAKIVQQDAKKRVKTKSFKLKRSIKVKAIKRSRRTIGVIVRTGTRSELGIDENSKYYYPAALEYGHPKAKAHPYLRPALDTNAQKALGVIAAVIGTGIRLEAAKQ